MCDCPECVRQRAERRRAEALALSCLRDHLTGQQRYEWDNHQGFDVVTPARRVFSIGPGYARFTAGDSYLGPTGRYVPPRSLCVYAWIPTDLDPIPHADTCLALKLALEDPDGERIVLATAI